MSVFAVLADDTRRNILDQLRAENCAVGTLVEALGTSQPVISKHLKILKDAGLVRSIPDGQRRVYELRTDGFEEVEAWLAPYRQFWSTRLDALGEYLASTQPTKENQHD